MVTYYFHTVYLGDLRLCVMGEGRLGEQAVQSHPILEDETKDLLYKAVKAVEVELQAKGVIVPRPKPQPVATVIPLREVKQ